MLDKLIDTFIVGGCIAAIVAGSLFGAWALFQTM